jgi:predicted phage terminase large subunit-like protein
MDKDWNIYLLDYTKGRWTPAQIVDNIFKVQSQWKPYKSGLEVNGFQRVLKLGVEDEMRRRKQFFGIEEIRNGPKASKASRISSLEPFYRDGKVYHMEWMKGGAMEDQLLSFPRSKHDDLIDAMAMVLPLLSPGIEHKDERVPEGSWEWAFRNAQHLNMGYRSFFGGQRGL